MGKKLRIGIVYSFNKNWIGGTYYIENVIAALATLPFDKQPTIKIFCESLSEFNQLKSRVNFPDLKNQLIYYKNPLIRSLNFFLRKITGEPLFKKKLGGDVDVLFPYTPIPQFRAVAKQLAWIPDFQELHYPHFFGANELETRNNRNSEIVAKKLPILFSSEDARKDFLLSFQNTKNKLFTVPFSVTHPEFHTSDEVFAKYKIPTRYFICTNQFWQHKNHIQILHALKILKAEGINMVFTGYQGDYRNPNFFSAFNDLIDEYRLRPTIFILGFIPREDQLVLIKKSVAIIQPSYFEGWSTVVEDAKALNHSILVSDIAVHHEQLGEEYPYYFPLDNPEALAKMMAQVWSSGASPIHLDYAHEKKKFAHRFMEAINEVTR